MQKTGCVKDLRDIFFLPHWLKIFKKYESRTFNINNLNIINSLKI